MSTPRDSVPPLHATRALTANAALAFVLAAIVNSVLHESAHAIAGLVQGLTPTISPFSVDYVPEGTTTERIITAAAGPLFSLVLGLGLIRLARSWGSGFGRLFWLWLAFMAVMNFVGYCFIAPFAHNGDTGQALALLGAPTWIFLIVSIIGVGGQFLLARRFAIEVKRYASGIEQERSLSFYSWMIGTPVVVVLTAVEALLMGAPAEQLVIVVAYGLAVGVFAPMQFLFSARVQNASDPLRLKPVDPAALGVTVVVAVAMIALAGQGGVTL